MDIAKVIPPWQAVAREGFIVLGGIVLAALIISRWPALQKFVQDNSITLKDSNGTVLW